MFITRSLEIGLSPDDNLTLMEFKQSRKIPSKIPECTASRKSEYKSI